MVYQKRSTDSSIKSNIYSKALPRNFKTTKRLKFAYLQPFTMGDFANDQKFNVDSKIGHRHDGFNGQPNWVPVGDQPLFTEKKLRVVCVGAGFAGLMVAYKWKHQFHMDSFIDLAIYEKNADVGGTWLENQYPGVACDV